jgi:hypothetical protein
VDDGHNTVRKLALVLEREERPSKWKTDTFLESHRKKAAKAVVSHLNNREAFMGGPQNLKGTTMSVRTDLPAALHNQSREMRKQ